MHGRPAPSVIWLKSGRTLTSGHYVPSHDGQHRYSLTIKQVQEDDFGEYTCMAESDLGSTNSSLRLTGKLLDRGGGGVVQVLICWYRCKSISQVQV